MCLIACQAIHTPFPANIFLIFAHLSGSISDRIKKEDVGLHPDQKFGHSLFPAAITPKVWTLWAYAVNVKTSILTLAYTRLIPGPQGYKYCLCSLDLLAVIACHTKTMHLVVFLWLPEPVRFLYLPLLVVVIFVIANDHCHFPVSR